MHGARLRHLPGVAVDEGDALQVLAARGPFDVALMMHLLEHDDPVSALRTVAAHARRVVIEVPVLSPTP